MSFIVEKISPSSFDPVVADEIAQSISEAIELNGKCTLVLAGGQTPGSIYRLLSKPPRSNIIDWNKLHIFWGDERWVPKEHNSSNYKLVHDTLFHGLQMPLENIHGVNCMLASPLETAREYEAQIIKFFSLSNGEVPAFDIILLGIGSDGHTASLFPNTDSLKSDRLVCESIAVEEPVQRVTLTFPVLNKAKKIFYMVKGGGKAQVLSEIISDSQSFSKYPAAFFHNSTAKVTWFVDSEAGRLLNE
jgi:6-phosphogluconolactonase